MHLLRLLAVIFIFPALCLAEDRQYLFGDWDGARASLEDRGFTLEAILTHELIANTSGGVHTTAGIQGNVDLTLEIDTEQAGWWKGGTVFLYALGNYGRNPSEYVGDVQVSSNIEAYDTAKLYEAWYNHSLLNGRLEVLFGLHDYNSEFNALEFAGTLINSSFGISPAISQVGPSIFSTTALALRLKAGLTEHWYLQGAIYDGVPGDPDNPRGTRIKHPGSDGYFYAAETGFNSSEDEAYYKLGIGGWSHTKDFEDISGYVRSSNQGLYAIAEGLLLPEVEGSEQGLGTFLQIAFSKSDRNQLESYFGAGFSYLGILPGRDADVLTAGVAIARNSARYRELNEGVDTAEVAIEFSYRAEIAPYFALQPDVQYIVNPGMDPALDDAVVVGIRAEVRL